MNPDQLTDQRVKQQIGELMVQTIALTAQLQAANARIAELEKPKPEPETV